MDFTTSQTRTERLQLRVVVRPSRPQIIDDGGTVLDLYAGPYRSGRNIFRVLENISRNSKLSIVAKKIYISQKYLCLSMKNITKRC